MLSDWRLTLLAAGVALAAVLPACSSTPPHPEDPSAFDRAVMMSEQSTLPMILAQNGRGGFTAAEGIVTLNIVNLGTSTVTVTNLKPAVDPGLDVTYFGYTGCPCITGSVDHPGDMQTAMKSRVGVLPFTIPPNSRQNIHLRNLVFLVSVEPYAMDTLRRGCLWVRYLQVKFSDGRSARVADMDRKPIIGAFADNYSLVPFDQTCNLQKVSPNP